MGIYISRGHDHRREGSHAKATQPSPLKGNYQQNGSTLRSHPLSVPKELTFTYNNLTVSTIVSLTTKLPDLNKLLLSAFGISESTHIVSGVLVTATGPLMPFFMVAYLVPNTPATPYRVVVSLLEDFCIDDWGSAPDTQEQNEVTVEWTEFEEIMKVSGESDDKLYSLPASSLLATRFFTLLRQYGYLRLHLPPASPLPALFQSASAAAHTFFSKPAVEKRKIWTGFEQSKFVGFSHAKGSSRQFVQLRTTRNRVKDDGKEVPAFDATLTEAYLALQNISYQLFKLLCHPLLTPHSHLSPDLYSSLLDAACPSVEALNECPSVPDGQFVGTNVFRIYQYLRHQKRVGHFEKKVARSSSDEIQLPGFLGASTSLHTDMGLLTVSPQSNLPGLTMIKHSDATRFVNVEMKAGSACVDGSDNNYIYVFIGETLAQLTKGFLLAPLHYVDERTPTQPRFSLPFFLRARQKSVLPAVEGMCGEMAVETFIREWVQQRKQMWVQTATSDF